MGPGSKYWDDLQVTSLTPLEPVANFSAAPLSGTLALVAGDDDARVFELGTGSPADPCDSGGGGGGGAWHEPDEPDQEVVLLASIDGGPLI